MTWLSRSFDQYTAAWLILSSLVGGVVGSLVKFTFEDLLRPAIGYRRDVRAVTRTYTTPLLRSAESLERRINNFVRNLDQHWYVSDDYYRVSTLYTFAEHLAWIRVVETKFGFLPFESTRKGKEFNQRLSGLFRALTSFAYFRTVADPAVVDASLVPRLMATAMGEVSLDREVQRPVTFTQFAVHYETDPQFQRWFSDLDRLLAAASQHEPVALDRLIAAAVNLRAFVTFLDPGGRLVDTRPAANLELLSHAGLRLQLAQEFPDLVT